MTQRAGDGNRTRDPELGRLVLYQLSYSRAARRAGSRCSDDGEGRIRTSEGVRRQIYSLLPLAARAPLRPAGRCRRMHAWSRWSESNRRPADYKSAALPPELHRQAAPRSRGCAVCRSKRSDLWESRRERSRGAPPPRIALDGSPRIVTKRRLITSAPEAVNETPAPAGDYGTCPGRRRSSKSATPVATETFSDSTPGAIGIRASKSQVRRTSGRSPSPSPPDDQGDPVRQIEVVEAPARVRHQADQPVARRRCSRSIARTRFGDPGDPEAEQGPGRGRHHDRGDADAAGPGAGPPPHPGRPGRAQDRPQVARVLDAVEDERELAGAAQTSSRAA